MSTNYYCCLDYCSCCERSSELHILLSSFGWAAHFQGYDGQYGYIDFDNTSMEVPEGFQLKSWKQWKEYLKDKPIIDEYGDSISYDEFVEMVETYKSPDYVNENGRKNLDHITEILNSPRYSDIHYQYRDVNDNWHDSEGYSFSRREFS